MHNDNPKGKPISIDEAIELLGADEVEDMDDASLDPIGLGILATQMAKRLVSTGGRPTDKSWTIAKRIPMKEETWKRLEEESERFRSRGMLIAPGQVAAVVLEKGLSVVVREDPCEAWVAADYEFEDSSEEEARELVAAIRDGGLW